MASQLGAIGRWLGSTTGGTLALFIGWHNMQWWTRRGSGSGHPYPDTSDHEDEALRALWITLDSGLGRVWLLLWTLREHTRG